MLSDLPVQRPPPIRWSSSTSLKPRMRLKPCVGASTEGVRLAKIHGKRKWWSNLAWNILCVRVEDREKYVRNRSNEPCPLILAFVS